MLSKKYNRVLLKVSGESFKGSGEFGQDFGRIDEIADDIIEVNNSKIQICIVVGGGNFYRGSQVNGIERPTADYIGMLATVMNAIVLQEFLQKKGIKKVKVLSSVPVDSICETYNRSIALAYMEDGHVVIFAGGTGNPFVSTDTAAAYRAIEMRCDVLLKGTQVSGVYSEDPETNPKAERFSNLSYDEIIDNDLKIMDLSSIVAAKDHQLPIMVFSLSKKGEFNKALHGSGEFTLIS